MTGLILVYFAKSALMALPIWKYGIKTAQIFLNARELLNFTEAVYCGQRQQSQTFADTTQGQRPLLFMPGTILKHVFVKVQIHAYFYSNQNIEQTIYLC